MHNALVPRESRHKSRLCSQYYFVLLDWVTIDYHLLTLLVAQDIPRMPGQGNTPL